jgi:hypothetical protein
LVPIPCPMLTLSFHEQKLSAVREQRNIGESGNWEIWRLEGQALNPGHDWGEVAEAHGMPATRWALLRSRQRWKSWRIGRAANLVRDQE